MKEPTDEQLMAFADRRLDDDETAAIEQLLKSRPDLAQRVAAFRATGSNLRTLIDAELKPSARMAELERMILAHPGNTKAAPAQSAQQSAGNGGASDKPAGNVRSLDAASRASLNGHDANGVSPPGAAGGAETNAGAGAKVIPFARPKPERKPSQLRSRLAIAATIALLAASAVALKLYEADLAARRTDSKGPQQVASNDVSLVDARALSAALETTPMEQQFRAGAWNVTPILTFSSKDGRYCREYVAEAAGDSRMGLACRAVGGGWSAIAEGKAALAPRPTPGASRVAGGSAPEAVEAASKRLKAGEVMDLSEEARVLARGWK